MPRTRMGTVNTASEAVMNRVFNSLPPKQRLAVQAAGTARWASCWPAGLYTVTPWPVRYTLPSTSRVMPSEPWFTNSCLSASWPWAVRW